MRHLTANCVSSTGGYSPPCSPSAAAPLLIPLCCCPLLSGTGTWFLQCASLFPTNSTFLQSHAFPLLLGTETRFTQCASTLSSNSSLLNPCSPFVATPLLPLPLLSGTETRLTQCASTFPTTNDCSHGEDITLTCAGEAGKKEFKLAVRDRAGAHGAAEQISGGFCCFSRRGGGGGAASEDGEGGLLLMWLMRKKGGAP